MACSTCPPLIFRSRGLAASFTDLEALTAYNVTVYGIVQNNSKTAGIGWLQFHTRIDTGGGGKRSPPPPAPPGGWQLELAEATATGPTTGQATAKRVGTVEFGLVS